MLIKNLWLYFFIHVSISSGFQAGMSESAGNFGVVQK
jgi:hypothetical protein